MPVCHFFQQGNCHFGRNCRNEHVQTNDNSSQSSQAPLDPEAIATIVKTVRNDVAPQGGDRPLYYLSVYAASKDKPNFIEGTDLSQDELRWQAYEAKANNTLPQYQQKELEYVRAMDDIFGRLHSSLPKSYKDFYQTGQPFNITAPQQAVSSFGAPAATLPAPGFGAFATPSPPTLGQPQQPSAFSQAPSAFGQPPANASAFQSAPAFGAQPTPTFGQTTSSAFNASQPAFGAPNTFGAAPAVKQPEPPTNAFANLKPATGGGFAAFASGGPSAFGGSSAAPVGASPFGQASGNAFAGTGQGAFGDPQIPSGGAFGSGSGAFVATPATAPGAFGGTPISGAGAFGQTLPAPTGAFGQPLQPQTSAFGAPAAPFQSAFGPSGTVAGTNLSPASGAFGGGVGTALPPGNGAFGGVAASPAGNPFAASNAPAATTTPFPSSTAGTFGAALVKKQVDLWADEAKEEELSEEMKAAFAADCFEWGMVPSLPPPVAMR